MTIPIEHIGAELWQGALYTAAAFGVNCAYGLLFNTPVLVSGVIGAVSTLAQYIINRLASLLENNCQLHPATVSFIATAATAVVTTAAIVATVAFGCFNPIGLVAFSLFGILQFAYMFTRSVYLLS